jgi:small subunit ribosomal protein S20
LTSITPANRPAHGLPSGIFSENTQNFLKLGIDFIGKGRYNVELYERLQTGGVTEMPNIKSSKKDVIRSKIAYEKNKADKSALKTALKKYDAALVAGDKAAAEVAYKVAVKAVDQAVIKGLLHKNNAARKKSSMTLKLNAMA